MNATAHVEVATVAACEGTHADALAARALAQADKGQKRRKSPAKS